MNYKITAAFLLLFVVLISISGCKNENSDMRLEPTEIILPSSTGTVDGPLPVVPNDLSKTIVPEQSEEQLSDTNKEKHVIKDKRKDKKNKVKKDKLKKDKDKKEATGNTNSFPSSPINKDKNKAKDDLDFVSANNSSPKVKRRLSADYGTTTTKSDQGSIKENDRFKSDSNVAAPRSPLAKISSAATAVSAKFIRRSKSISDIDQQKRVELANSGSPEINTAEFSETPKFVKSKSHTTPNRIPSNRNENNTVPEVIDFVTSEKTDGVLPKLTRTGSILQLNAMPNSKKNKNSNLKKQKVLSDSSDEVIDNTSKEKKIKEKGKKDDQKLSTRRTKKSASERSQAGSKYEESETNSVPSILSSRDNEVSTENNNIAAKKGSNKKESKKSEGKVSQDKRNKKDKKIKDTDADVTSTVDKSLEDATNTLEDNKIKKKKKKKSEGKKEKSDKKDK